MWELPIELKGAKIRNNGDYRVILDCICALGDMQMLENERLLSALFIFYEDLSEIKDFKIAQEEMLNFISNNDDNKPKNEAKIMDWEQDFKLIAPPVSRVIGEDIRSMKYLHWWTFLGAYMEVGECFFSQIVGIRSKKAKGKKLEKSEQEFYKNNYNKIEFKKQLSTEEEEWLNQR